MAEITITIQDIMSLAGKAAKQISFVGQLDETNVDQEATKIYDVINNTNSAPKIILDFGGLDYMNSKSIGYVTDWYAKVAEKGGKVVIAQPKANIIDILKVVGITQIIPVTASIEEAKGKLDEQEAAS